MDTHSDSNNEIPSAYTELKELRIKNIKRVIVAHSNINSIRNKFEALFDTISNNIDILMISESKINESFPTNQFCAKGYARPYRLDRNDKGGGILLYIRDDIPSKMLNSFKLVNMETIFVEINLRKKKWLFCCSYNPHKNLISEHLSQLNNALNYYSKKYDNIIVMGDLNCETTEEPMINFCENFNFRNLVKEPTCFKNPTNPSLIDIILTNRSHNFLGTSTVETGLSDFHKMTITVLKTHFVKQEPKIITYRDYKSFDQPNFRTELNRELSKFNFHDMVNFKRIFLQLLNKHAPEKKKYVRANNKEFVNKELRKAIMLRSKLRNNFLKEKTDLSRLAYNKQRNICVYLLKKAKREYFGNLDTRVVTDNKKFWKYVCPFFSDQFNSKEKIILIENNEIISQDQEVCHVFNKYFSNIVRELNIPEIHRFPVNIKDPVMEAVLGYQNHPSVVAIKKEMENCPTGAKFYFQHVSAKKVQNELNNLDSKKACQANDIPTKLIKDNIDIFNNLILKDFNRSLDKCLFPADLKNAEVVPVFKKGDKTNKENYRPVSILSNISKVYERCIYDQICSFFDTILSKLQCGFRKGFSAQTCLLVMVEKWRKSIDSGNKSGAVLTDLSKAFDCLPHDLFIAKLHAYGFSREALNYIYSYLTNRRQRVKMNSTFSSLNEIE